MPMPDGPHLDLLREAIALEADAQRALLAGAGASTGADSAAIARGLAAAAAKYRASWELAPPASYGRLIGMLKAAVIADGSAEAARAAAQYAREQITAHPSDSPPASYAVAIAALVLGDDGAAREAATRMRAGSPAFGRAAEAIDALARDDAAAYAASVAAIVADFEARPADAHLTGVAIADTAVMLERLAEPRGLATHPASRVMPPS